MSTRRRAALLVAAAFAFAVPSLAGAAPAQAWQCESSALRGTALGATLEPVTANRGAATCRPVANALTGPLMTLPLPLDLSGIAARTTLNGPEGNEAAQEAGAAGGVADLRVRALPELPIQLPLPDLSGIAPITLPGATVDIRPALQALLPDGKLPNVDLVRVRAVVASAEASCVNGAPQLRGASHVTGLAVLGEELPLNGVVEQALSLIDSSSIDPSNIDISKVEIVSGAITLPLLQTLLQPILDGMEPIAIPGAVAQVRVTPGEQVRDAASLTQRALRMQVSVLDQSLADLVVGEATVRSAGVDCAPAPAQSAADLALQCTNRRLVLADVLRTGDRVRLSGFADRRYVGRDVSLRFRGRQVAQARVRSNGSFTTYAPLPRRKIRDTNLARYRARIGKEKSLRLKLARRMRVTRLQASRNRVVIRGRVTRPLAKPRRRIEIRQRISCAKWRVVKRVRPQRNGRFRVTVGGPPQARAAVYRLATRVRKNRRNPKTYPTFTLPRYVDLG